MKVFRLFDEDNTGFITFRALKRICHEIGEGLYVVARFTSAAPSQAAAEPLGSLCVCADSSHVMSSSIFPSAAIGPTRRCRS
jgi:hypothetical protein